MKHTAGVITLLFLMMILIVAGCSKPPTQQEAKEAVQSFASGGFMGAANFGLMQDTPCMGVKITRSEIVKIKKASGSEYDPFPGKSKHIATLVEEGQCGYSGKFYLERDFLLVRKGPDGLHKDSSGKWGVWPLEFVYDKNLLASVEDTYDEVAKQTGSGGWLMLLMMTSKMEKNDIGINIWPRNEDHYYFEMD